MKVKDLIERLKKLDQEALIVVSGYEGGVREAESAHQVTVALKVNMAWYYGEHEIVDPQRSKNFDDYDKAKAVIVN